MKTLPSDDTLMIQQYIVIHYGLFRISPTLLKTNYDMVDGHYDMILYLALFDLITLII